MYKKGDRVRVIENNAIGIITEVMENARVCVEFDGHAGSRTEFNLSQIEPAPEHASQLSGSCGVATVPPGQL